MVPGDRPDEPPARGALPADLVGDYLAERGAADIPMPGGLSRADWLTRRPALREPFTAQLGWRNGPAEPLSVVYGPCPRCGEWPQRYRGSPCHPAWTAPARASGDVGHAPGEPRWTASRRYTAHCGQRRRPARPDTGARAQRGRERRRRSGAGGSQYQRPAAT